MSKINKDMLKAIKILALAAVLINIANKLPEPPAMIAGILMLALPFLMAAVTVSMAISDVVEESRESRRAEIVTNNYFIIADQKRSTQYLDDLNVIDVAEIEMK